MTAKQREEIQAIEMKRETSKCSCCGEVTDPEELDSYGGLCYGCYDSKIEFEAEQSRETYFISGPITMEEIRAAEISGEYFRELN
jgi:Zn finger protein HypA/HybF involved in hydrogenase expression